MCPCSLRCDNGKTNFNDCFPPLAAHATLARCMPGDGHEFLAGWLCQHGNVFNGKRQHCADGRR